MSIIRAWKYIQSSLKIPSVIDGWHLCVKKFKKKFDSQKSIRKLNSMEQTINSMYYFMLLKEICPNVVSQIASKIDIPSRIVEMDVSSRYSKVRMIANIRNQAASCYADIGEIFPSLSGDAALGILEKSLDTAITTKPHMASKIIIYSKMIIYDNEVTLRYCNIFKQFEKSQIWNRCFKRTWCIYIASLIERGDNETALSVLRQYNKKFGLSGIEEWLSVAKFACEHGFSDSFVKRSADLYQLINQNHINFEEYLTGKNIAVVGNAPNEIGLGKGPLIDAHDVVMRMNSFDISSKYQPDYGASVDVWVQNPLFSYPLCDNIKLKYIFLSGHPDWHFYPRDKVVSLTRQVTTTGTKLVCMPLTFLRRLLVDMGGRPRPTTGAKVLAYIKSFTPGFSCSDVYGFSFNSCDGCMIDWSIPFHYYSANYDQSHTMDYHFHSLDLENLFLRSLFS